MKKQCITFLLTILISMMGVQGFAHDIEVANADGVTIYYTYINNIPELEVSCQGFTFDSFSNEYTGHVVIPETVTYNGTTYSVTSIGGSAFRDCSSLTSVTIPNSVTSIGYGAFLGTSIYNSTSDGIFYVDKWVCGYKGEQPSGNLVIEEGSRGISCYAFYECSGLMSVIIPNSVKSIGNHSFQFCYSLSSVTIPNSVTIIGEYAFSQCRGLTSISLSTSINRIAKFTFQSCENLHSITIPEGVTNIEENAFKYCYKLKDITIPKSLKRIDGNTFYDCHSIENVYISDLEAWCNLLFSNSADVTNPAYGYEVGASNPFHFNKYGNHEHHLILNGEPITNLVIPDGVTKISNEAFYNIKDLTAVTIPHSVSTIGSNAFGGCDNLLTIRSEITEPFNCKDVFSKNTLRNGVLHIPAGTKDIYARFDGWREFLNIVEVGGESEQYVWLTMKDGRGITKLKLKQGTRQELEIRPETGWKILTTTMDGRDISSLIKSGNVYTTSAIMNDATITIVYEKDNTSGTFSARQSKADISVVDDGVVISNAEPQSRCIVYGANGLPVTNTVITDSTHKITLPKGQVYLLTLGDRTLKFAL